MCKQKANQTGSTTLLSTLQIWNAMDRVNIMEALYQAFLIAEIEGTKNNKLQSAKSTCKN
jgi:hypothetical protein